MTGTNPTSTDPGTSGPVYRIYCYSRGFHYEGRVVRGTVLTDPEGYPIDEDKFLYIKGTIAQIRHRCQSRLARPGPHGGWTLTLARNTLDYLDGKDTR